MKTHQPVITRPLNCRCGSHVASCTCGWTGKGPYANGVDASSAWAEHYARKARKLCPR